MPAGMFPSRLTYLPQIPSLNLEDEAADCDRLGSHPTVLSQLPQLLPDVFLDVGKGVEAHRRICWNAGSLFDRAMQLFLGRLHQTAIGVIDDHELLRAEQVMGNQQGSNSVVGDDAARVANQVSISRSKAQRAA